MFHVICYMNSMEWTQLLIELIQSYGYIIIFLGTIIAGETVILAAAFLASLGYFNIFIVMAVSAVGIILADSFWYYIGMKSDKVVEKCGKSCTFAEKRIAFINKNFNNHYGKFLILSKFVYGTRVATLIASGHQKIPYKNFLIFNLISIIIWLAIVVVIGYGIGFSWTYLEKYNEYARYLALGILAVIIAIRLYVTKFAKFKKYLNFDFVKNKS